MFEYNVITRRCSKEEEIPYDLLLLADETIEAINRYIHQSDCYVFEHQGQLLGLYVLFPINNHCIEIKNIAVLESAQGKGIGTLLIRDAIQKAKEQSYTTILIGTANTAFKQLYLYQKEGFEIDDIKKNFFIDNYPTPIYEKGILLNHMIMLKKTIEQ
ncbi:GNAT family N-acetyltransferase [Aureispira sp. CCB-E]|uniref:GNAT family N-acetyltransferase n=1 Tax=Aureispira sp. CCB-E TaxID=3051121 RepID=UPI0028684BAB|nr:GNAT family N-acetyltransferase [Aureispira sp. CCB-E]WMX12705.1 GNAT family N-acetyltransferase [Aureispira sp. CCB-E]